MVISKIAKGLLWYMIIKDAFGVFVDSTCIAYFAQ